MGAPRSRATGRWSPSATRSSTRAGDARGLDLLATKPRHGQVCLRALDPGPPDRGVRPARRPRRPDPRVDRRGHRPMSAIRAATPDDWPQIWPFFAATVEAGETYAYPEDLTSEQAAALWMEQPPGATVVYDDGGVVLGSAKMGPNRPARGSHVGTASFMVAPGVTRARRGPGTRRVRRAVAPRPRLPRHPVQRRGRDERSPRSASGRRSASRSSAPCPARSCRSSTATSACT